MKEKVPDWKRRRTPSRGRHLTWDEPPMLGYNIFVSRVGFLDWHYVYAKLPTWYGGDKCCHVPSVPSISGPCVLAYFLLFFFDVLKH